MSTKPGKPRLSAGSEPPDLDRVPTLGEAFGVWLRIGLLSFGGPAGQIALMHRMLVDERRWIDEARFLHALNYCMLLPGPEAQQLATYIGWLMHRMAGGLVAGILFVLPGALVMLALSIVYVLWAGLPLVEAAFLGVKATVLVVVVEAVIRIGRRALKTTASVAVAAAAFVAIFAFDIPFPAIIALAAAAGVLGAWRAARGGGGGPSSPAGKPEADDSVIARLAARGGLAHTEPSTRRAVLVTLVFGALWAGPVLGLAATLGPDHVLSEIASFFSTLAIVTFGGAYAVLAYMAQQAVDAQGWMTGPEMLDGLGLAETTPGPLIMVTQFVGFLAAYRETAGPSAMLAGVVGAALTTWVTFVPCFLWIFLGAPYVERVRANRHLSAALSAISASVVGVVLNLALWFGLKVVFAEVTSVAVGWASLPVPTPASIDPVAACLTIAAAIAVFRFHLGIVKTLALAAAAAMAVSLIGT